MSYNMEITVIFKPTDKYDRSALENILHGELPDNWVFDGAFRSSTEGYSKYEYLQAEFVGLKKTSYSAYVFISNVFDELVDSGHIESIASIERKYI